MLKTESFFDSSRYAGSMFTHNLQTIPCYTQDLQESFSQLLTNTSSRFSSIGRDFTPSLNPTPVILVQDTFRHLSLLPDILSISTSPSLDNSLQSAIISDSRFGIDSTPSTNQTPVIIVLDTFIYLSLFPDILSISI